MKGLCTWVRLDIDNDEAYETSCGQAWQFLTGSISDNAILYCPYCGERIEDTENESSPL